MYDAPWQRDPYESFEHPYGVDDADRIIHLVHLDGRLVDAWSEPVERSRWAALANRLDRERDELRRPPAPPQPPGPPAHERLLRWLQGLVGGSSALEAIDCEPLARLTPIDLETLPLGTRHRHEGLLALVDRVTGVDEELDVALANALRLAHDLDPTFWGTFTSAGQAAAALVWAVGKANALFTPDGSLRQKDVASQLGLPGQLSGAGRRVESLLVGAPGLLGPRPHGLGCPDLLALGTPVLLTSSTRRLIVRLRDQAVRAGEAAA